MRRYTWIEPDKNGGVIKLVMSEEEVIAMRKKYADERGHKYSSDQEALEDFLIVYWAVEEK
jgi:hypothetical protein